MSNQLKLGIFTAVGILTITISIIATMGSFSLVKTYHVYTEFDSISGLLKKAKVKIAGINVGVLRSISLHNLKAKLKLSINKNIVLYKNAYARIVSVGVVGKKYIEIVPGSAVFPVVKDGDFIPSVTNVSIENALSSIVNKINKALDSEKDGDIAKNLADAIYSLKKVLNSLAAQNDHLVSLIENFNKFSSDLASISERNKQDLIDIISSVKSISAKGDILISRVCNGKGIISSIVNDEQMSKDIKETLESAKKTINDLNDRMAEADRLQLNWNYVGKYNLTDGKYKTDIGINIVPNNSKFYYMGISNVADTLGLDAFLGFRSRKAKIYAGIMKNSGGIGLGYSFFQPIYASYRTLEACLNMHNFEDKWPEIDAGVKIGILKWLYIGVDVESITHKTVVTSYLKIEINDRDLARLLGIVGLAKTVAP